MFKSILKLGLLVFILIIISACAVPPPPISNIQLEDAKIAALDAEKQIAEQNSEIKALEEELKQKEAEFSELKEYEQQLKDEGFLGEE